MAVLRPANGTQFSDHARIWNSLKRAIAESSGFKSWKGELPVGEAEQLHWIIWFVAICGKLWKPWPTEVKRFTFNPLATSYRRPESRSLTAAFVVKGFCCEQDDLIFLNIASSWLIRAFV
jgi:hypothetical protein